MRLALSAAAALLVLIVMPVQAPAQNLGGIIGTVASHAAASLFRRGARKALRPYAYRAHRPRARVARHHGPSRAAMARAQHRRAVPAAAAAVAAPLAVAPAVASQAPQSPALPSQALPPQAGMGQLPQPEAFWPRAPQDLFDYVLESNEVGLRAHGYGVLTASMFAQPPRQAGRSVAAAKPSAQTTGSGSSGDEIVCDEASAARADAVMQRLRERLALSGEQGALAELHAALVKADEQIAAACPQTIPATVPDRLRAVQGQLWAMRVAATGLRAPLQKFYDTLTAEQKAKLDVQPIEREGGAPGGSAAMLCLAQTQQAPQWPAAQVVRSIRPNQDQRARLEALKQTSSQMHQAMMGSCPQKPPATMLARLDAALDWIDAVLFATTNIAVPVEDFYRTLSDAQKARLDTLSL